MRNRMCVFTVVAIGVMALRAFADEADSPTHLPEPPAGHFLVQEELWNDLSDEPGQHMDRAREAFLMVDARAAAAELRKAATYLRITAGQAAIEAKIRLNRSAHELEGLAARVETGSVKSVAELDRAIARALHALSHHHCVLAERSWLNHQAERAGKQLRSAADNLDRAVARTGKALQTATGAVVKETRVISGKLVEGTGYMFDEVGKGFATFGKQVETVGKGIEPHGSPTANEPRNDFQGQKGER